MTFFRPLTAAEQAANHLRTEISRRRLGGAMPGIHQLAAELNVNHKTVKAALEIPQKENFITWHYDSLWHYNSLKNQIVPS